MQKRNIIIAGIVICLVAVFFIFNSKNNTVDTTVDTALTEVSSFSHAHGLAVDIVDPSKVYIATHEGLYLFLEDTTLYRIGKTRDDLMGFVQHPTEQNTFFSSGHPARGGNIGFQKSVDGGVTWGQVSPGIDGPVDFHTMTVSPINPDLIYGYYGGKLQRSTDGGNIWEYALGAMKIRALASDYTEESKIYASTTDGVWLSVDRGDTWSPLSDELLGDTVNLFAPHPTETNYALTFSKKLGGLGQSSDGGISWTKVAEDFSGEAVLYLAFSKSSPDIAYLVTDKNSIYKSTDKGNSWAKVW